MNRQPHNPFDSIESAQGFVALLCDAVTEAHRELLSDLQRETQGQPSRRLEALRVASYNVEKLEGHLNASRRLLNDLRTLRRLLYQERKHAAAAAAPPVAETKVDVVRIPKEPLTPISLRAVSAKPRVIAVS